MVSILLGRTCTDIPFSASFDLETLDSIFQLGNSSQMVQQTKICPGAAYVLLAMIRVLIHQVCELLCVNSLHVLSMMLTGVIKPPAVDKAYLLHSSLVPRPAPFLVAQRMRRAWYLFSQM